MIECVTRKLFRREDKIICRDAWLISWHHGGLDNIGQTITYRLWLDNDTCGLWWQHHPHPHAASHWARRTPTCRPRKTRRWSEPRTTCPATSARWLSGTASRFSPHASNTTPGTALTSARLPLRRFVLFLPVLMPGDLDGGRVEAAPRALAG